MLSLFSAPKLENVVRDVNTLLKESKAGEALSLIEKATKKNIYHADLFLMCSRAHALLQDAEKERDALDRYIRENEKDVLHHLRAVESLTKDKNYALAQSILDQTKKRFPLSSFPHAVQAKLCCAQEQYEEAAKALLQKQHYGKLEDSDIDVVHQIKKQIKIGKLNLNDLIKQLLEGEQVKQIELRDHYSHFISLGTDCEFGMIQNLRNTKQPSLFRNSHMPLSHMLKLFNTRLSDFALPANAKIDFRIVESTGRAEYWFHVPSYKFSAHTGNIKQQLDFNETDESIHKRIRANFSLLIRKLLENLEDGDKIFVYKSRDFISVEQCKELLSSLCSIGNNKLLVVMLDQADKPTFEIVQPNLIIGRMNAWWQDYMEDPIMQSKLIASWDSLISASYCHFQFNFPEMNLP